MIKNAILGAIIGDAVGVPYEFEDRGSFKATDMVGHGTHEQPVGTWSDDSSMMLCIVQSVNECGFVNPEDILVKFKMWYREAYMTPHGRVFDIGATTSQALYELPWFDRYAETSNGNGALMRTLPLAFLHKDKEVQAWRDEVFDVAALTHGHLRSRIACLFYCLVAKSMSEGMKFEHAYANATNKLHFTVRGSTEQEHFERIQNGSIITCPESEIRSGGYVIDTLEAAMWCMHNSSSYEDAVLKAVNLGDDTDTTACVVGGLAGLCWEIPENWKAQLVKLDMIEKMLNVFEEKTK